MYLPIVYNRVKDEFVKNGPNCIPTHFVVKLNAYIHKYILVPWSSGITASAYGVKGREIESRRGIG
jgi:hypothetical protein